jgi:hypothetical protein
MARFRSCPRPALEWGCLAWVRTYNCNEQCITCQHELINLLYTNFDTTGLFIGLQDKFVVCGPGLTVLSMVLRFVAAPAATAVGALVLGLRGDLMRVAILQVTVHI